MNETNAINLGTPANSMKMLRAMLGIGIVCALMIVLTYEGTLPRIERLKAEALEKAIFKVIPGIASTRAYYLNENNGFSALNDGEVLGQLVYAGYDENNKFKGVAIEASGQGYADVIRILYGYNPDKQVINGFNVLESKETPGLGDKIEKNPKFLANFEALDVSLVDDQSAVKNKVITVKHGTKENAWEVDGITGATISSRAIGNIIGTSTEHLVPLIFKNTKTFDTKFENEKTQ